MPGNGGLGWLVGGAAAAVGLLAVLTIAFGLAANRLGDSWSGALAGSATVRVSGPAEELDARVAAALRVLTTTPGVASARALSSDEQERLLIPWLGDSYPLDAMALPRLIAVSVTGDGPDTDGLILRLEGEVPGAVFEDHGQWRGALLDAAEALTLLATGACALILALLWGIVAIGTHATLDAHRGILVTLRLLGAEDRYIIRAFTRRMVQRASLGAGLGTILAIGVLLALPQSDASLQTDRSILTGLTPIQAEWLAMAVVPFAAGLAAYLAAGRTARRVLRSVA